MVIIHFSLWFLERTFGKRELKGWETEISLHLIFQHTDGPGKDYLGTGMGNLNARTDTD